MTLIIPQNLKLDTPTDRLPRLRKNLSQLLFKYFKGFHFSALEIQLYSLVFRFDIHYYTCGGCSVLLNVDTRAHDDVVGTLRSDDISATPLEKLIHTKYDIATSYIRISLCSLLFKVRS